MSVNQVKEIDTVNKLNMSFKENENTRRVYFSGKKAEGKFALVSKEDFQEICRYRWFITKDGYAARNGREGAKRLHVLMHRQVMGFPKSFIDHKESRPLKTRPHSAPTGAAFGFCYAPPLARDSESTND